MKVETIEIEDIEILEKLKLLSLHAGECSLSSGSERQILMREAEALEKVLNYVMKKTRNKRCLHCGKYFKAKDYRTRYCNECKHKNYNVEGLKKRVIQYDLENNIIEVYESVREASRETGVSKSCISAVATGKRKSTSGFIWRYE